MKNYVLFEIDLGVFLSRDLKDWVKHSPTVYKLAYFWDINTRDFKYGKGAYGWGFYGGSGTKELPGPNYFKVAKVGSFIGDAEVFSMLDSIEDIKTVNKSFFFDTNTQTIYVNFGEIKENPWNYVDLTLGIIKGYSNYPIYEGNLLYDPKIQSIPNISIQRDNLLSGVVRFEGGDVSLINTDHEFDLFNQEDIYGKVCRIKWSNNGVFETVFVGKLDNFSITDDPCILSIKDARKSLLTNIPNNYFNLDDYPQLSTNNDGQVIPIGYGKVIASKAYCTNETVDEAASYTFKFFDTSFGTPQSIQDVRVDGKSVTIASTNLSAGTFTLAGYVGGVYTVYEPGQEVLVDYTGKNITNPLEIIEDLIDYYLDIPYIDYFYNTDNWDVTKVGLPEIALGLDKTQTLADIIGKITLSILGSFVIDADGKFNIKLVDITKEPVLTLFEYDNFDAPKIEFRGEEYASSCIIKYNTGVSTGQGPQVINKSLEQDLFIKYDRKQEQIFHTLLINKDDAEDYADRIMELYGGIHETVYLKTKDQAINLELEDLIDVYLYELGNTQYRIRLEVVGKEIDYLGNTIQIIGRYVSYPDGTPPRSAKIKRR